MSLHPQATDTDQPLLLQPLVSHPHLRGQRARRVEVSTKSVRALASTPTRVGEAPLKQYRRMIRALSYVRWKGK